MSEELKCPMGCDEILNAESDQYYACENCWFRCDKADLPRITAAMELAKACVEIDKAVDDESDDSMEVVYEKFSDAEKRVLEVFK